MNTLILAIKQGNIRERNTIASQKHVAIPSRKDTIVSMSFPCDPLLRGMITFDSVGPEKKLVVFIPRPKQKEQK